MVEVTGDHVGAAAEHSLERVRAAFQVDQIDGKARLLELAELLGEHGRQIAQAGATADGDRDLGLRRRERRRQDQHECGRCEPAKHAFHRFLHSLGGQDRAARTT
jgi:hypothetical protein